MKSEIHECQKNKLLRVSRKVLMLIALIFGTSVMVNANTLPLKSNATKEVKANKFRKHRHGRKAIVAKTTAPGTAVSKTKK